MSSLSALLINDDAISVPFSLEDEQAAAPAVGGYKLGRFQVPRIRNVMTGTGCS